MPESEYIIFCDESESEGKFYSNFYGGLIVGASQYRRITERLNAKKAELNLFGEIKWSKVTARYLTKYEDLVQCFFEEIKEGNVKLRVMFRQNAHVAANLSRDDHEMGYFKLYYQFIKHAFGLQYIERSQDVTRLRIYFDQFPDTREKAEQFKGFLQGLGSYRGFRDKNLKLERENITEVRSHDHVLMQCLDVVLGSVCFRLNDRHKAKPSSSNRRGSRTIAKEKLYKRILAEIRSMRPNFNIGESTGQDGDPNNRWRHSYRHWKFRSRESEYNAELTKSKGIKNRPTLPT
ncbi:MAG: DUF3800 domain-containing protein [Acidobacteria bacterium]|nr:DUF3800 domain-containing protein [Acidobacteriota bacterium]